VGPAKRSKLFHAIVGLGLAAVGCGGRETGAADIEAGQEVHGDGASPGDANAHAEAAETEDAAPLILLVPDAATALDSAVAADVAADVSVERWVPIPIA
jgi:hypothetical protein